MNGLLPFSVGQRVSVISFKQTKPITFFFMFFSMFFLTCCVGAPFEVAIGAEPKKANRTKKITSEEILKSYSLEQIAQVSNYFLARVEAEPMPEIQNSNQKNTQKNKKSAQKIMKCDSAISIEKVVFWMSGPLRALGDEKREAVVSEYLISPQLFADKVRGCAKVCTCNTYQLLFESLGDQISGDSNHKKNLELMKLEMRQVGQEQSLKCAKELGWFCESPLHRFLKQQ